MPTFCGVDLVARRELRFDKEALAVAGAWSEDYLDTTVLDGTSIQSLVVFFLELEQATIIRDNTSNSVWHFKTNDSQE